MSRFITIVINTTLTSFIEIFEQTYLHYILVIHNFFNDVMVRIPFSFSVESLSPLQYEFISPLRPVQDDKFVKALIEHTCLTFCLQVTD